VGFSVLLFVAALREDSEKGTSTRPSPTPEARRMALPPAPTPPAKARRRSATTAASSDGVYVRGYYRKNGTYVHGYTRQR
jgi:hypothetical protein